jgi:hypothetical protein
MMPCVTRDQTVIVNNRHKLLNGLTTQQKPKHSFSIDALVGSGGSDSCGAPKDGSSSRHSSTPSPASDRKSLSPPVSHVLSSPPSKSSAFASPAHPIPTSDLLRFMSGYGSAPTHVSTAPHFGAASHQPSHHPHHPSPHPGPHHPTHPMALHMINSMSRSNHIAPDFYNSSVNLNPAFGHWSPYMRHSQLLPPMHGMYQSFACFQRYFENNVPIVTSFS